MLHIFIDESGDLGFTDKSSKYYILASVEVKHPCTEEVRNTINKRVFKKIRRKLKKK